ncbi:MAG: ATP-dependent Clp protease proteolytic subunit [Bacteroidales bacterium]|nr:ATP-dependent Clp protease proteolytic subunit [Bacteroidales bacterium]MCM1146467.1 ATP-dependent Clp protease proteolytic subunit [Bacteroidales bacterium]MCM1205095.1 ATP-dependent Clp protease proteolytic subunit [Bacillota bacterium]MCM1509341.1 ATP-dependent Clp protease proteolytic subunit [Clostridium sp.]
MENIEMTKDGIITISGAITPVLAETLIQDLNHLNNTCPDIHDITIYISSPGGDIDIAIEIYRLLQTLDCTIRTINTSYVNSAAIIIYLAGSIRECYKTSSFFVHSVKKKLRGNYDSAKLLKEAKELNISTDKVTNILSQNTIKSKLYWKRLMKQGEILTATKALNLGIATLIIEESQDI